MTYSTNLEAAQQESTPEMYEFTSGSVVQRMTSYPSDVTFIGNTYKAKAIKRGAFAYDAEFGSTEVKIQVVLTNDFKKFLANQPMEPTSIKIYRAITSDLTDYVIKFNGQIKNVVISGNAAQLECDSRSRYLSKMLPKVIYQAFCNHDIYDSGCGVLAATYKVTGIVTSVSGAELVSTAWANGAGYADDYFTHGYIVFGTDMRMIVGHVDDTITLHVPFGSAAVAGISVDVYPGCDGNHETCINRFNNIENFLGMPFIPSRNPTVFGFK